MLFAPKRLFPVCALLCGAVTVFAQNFFQKTYHLRNEFAESLVVLPDNHVVLAGTVEAPGDPSTAFLQRINQQGDLLWANTYSLPGAVQVYDITTMTDGNLLVCWLGLLGDGTGRGGWMAVTPLGDVVWCKSTPAAAEFPVLKRITPLADGNYLLSGFWLSSNGLSTESFLLKIDNAGNRLWSNRFSENKTDQLTGCYEDAGGILHCAGSRTIANGEQDGIYAKIGPNGALIAPVRQYDLGETDRFTQVTGTTGDRLLMAGSTNGSLYQELWLLEIDGAGALRWSRTYGLPEQNLEPNDLLHLPGDQFMLTLNDDGAAGPDNEALLFKVDLSGELVLLANRYRANGETDVLRRVRPISDGFVACGWARRNGDSDFFLARTDANGDIPGCCPVARTLTIRNVTPQNDAYVPAEQTALGVANLPGVMPNAVMPEIFTPCRPIDTDFTLSADTICPGECLIVTLSGDTPGAEYTFTFTGGEPDPTQTGRICYPQAGQFVLTRTGQLGLCTQPTSKPVTVTASGDLKKPTAFSPDGDDTNDRFRPLFACPPEQYRLRLYNRWGQLMFESTEPDEGWDGTTDGDPAPADVYVWQVSYAGGSDSGEVTLLR